MTMRLQVFLSRAGVCSRRRAFDAICSGRVRVAGRVIKEPSFAVDETAPVSLDGRDVFLGDSVTILLHKPRGVTSTVADPFAEKTVLELLPESLRRVHPVGRLDKDTTGLLLLTNDGTLTHRVIHPSFEIEKGYRVSLDRALSEDDRLTLERGVLLDGKRTAPCRIKKLSGAEVEMTIHEGRKRQVRRMFAERGYHVRALCRVRQGFLTLGALKPGEWRYLTADEVKKLKADKSCD